MVAGAPIYHRLYPIIVGNSLSETIGLGVPLFIIHDIPIINGYIPLLLVIRRCCHFRTGLLRQLRTRRQLRT